MATPEIWQRNMRSIVYSCFKASRGISKTTDGIPMFKKVTSARKAITEDKMAKKPRSSNFVPFAD